MWRRTEQISSPEFERGLSIIFQRRHGRSSMVGTPIFVGVADEVGIEAAYVWCLFGIADLVVAVMMGGMTSPGRAHLFALEAPNLLISSYPLVMVPTFAVPLALMLHGLVLWRLRRETAPTGQLAVA